MPVPLQYQHPDLPPREPPPGAVCSVLLGVCWFLIAVHGVLVIRDDWYGSACLGMLNLAMCFGTFVVAVVQLRRRRYRDRWSVLRLIASIGGVLVTLFLIAAGVPSR